jgi:hypothetical protein
MTPLIIFTFNSVGHVFTWWQGELRTFQDEAAARAFASKQGLRPEFAAVDDQHVGSEAG